jgi:metallo-beta-lactamase class B
MKSKYLHRAVACALGVAFSVFAIANAQAEQSAPAATGNDAMYVHIMKAEKAAGDDLKFDFYHRCFIDPNYTGTIAKQRKMTAAIEPLQVFDNLYFIGQNAVSSWALKTSQGLIIFDTENNPDEAKQFIEGGLAKLGLDAHSIKYIVITHEHADHFGGSKYLQQQYPNAHILASATAWQNMPTANRGAGLFPNHDADITDGEKLTLGDTTVTFYITPGHTDGTVSSIFKVTDHGKPHTVGFFGGMGSPNTEANRQKIIASYGRWQTITTAAGVDTLIANHQGQDHSVEKLEYLRVKHPGDPNPYVLGKETYQRYFTVQTECTYANLVRQGGATE